MILIGVRSFSLTSLRYQHFPMMENYDKMASGEFCPYAMLSGPLNYHDEVVTTDKHGFRWSECSKDIFKIEDIDKYEKVNVLIGGSTVFGVGASSNASTISSLLAKETKEVWLNLGLRGGVAFQEYIHLIRFIYKANKVNNLVFMSGNNDLYINLVSELTSDFDRRFGELESMSYPYSCKKRFLAGWVSSLTGIAEYRLLRMSVKKNLSFLFKKRVINEKGLSLDEKFDRLIEQYSRNFLLYSALQNQLDCKVSFVLQPFFSWTGKIASDLEQDVFSELERLQNGSMWSFYKQQMDINLYQRYRDKLKVLAEKYDIQFVDSNPYFVEEKTLFVDAVHLNDNGNKIIQKIICDTILIGQ